MITWKRSTGNKVLTGIVFVLQLLKFNILGNKVVKVEQHWNSLLGGPSRVPALYDENEALLLGGESVLHLARAGFERLIRPLRIFVLLACARPRLY